MNPQQIMALSNLLVAADFFLQEFQVVESSRMRSFRRDVLELKEECMQHLYSDSNREAMSQAILQHVARENN